MTATLSSSANNLSSLITNDAKLNELLIKQEEKHHPHHSLLLQHHDLESIQHPKIKKFLKTYHSSNTSNKNGILASLNDQFSNQQQQQQQLHLQLQAQQQQQQQQQLRKFTESMHFDSDNWSAPPPNSLIKSCLALAAAENEYTEKSETLLHGERITCFIVGGEKRLCLPQMLNYVLKDFTVQEINNVCEKLHIYCSRCTQEQLDTLKFYNILPPSAPSCGLITLSDAERLCHKLLSSYVSKHKKSTMLANEDQENRVQLKVYHCCFGRAYGIVYPHLYLHANSQCIECEICHSLFSPQNFVAHAHRNDESRICHWGFDSNNWRFYIKLVDAYKEDHKYKLEFESFKNKFSNKRKSMNDDLATTGCFNPLKNSSTEMHSTNGSLFKKLLKTSDPNTLENLSINSDAQLQLINSITNKTVDQLQHTNATHHSHQHHLMNNEHKLLNDLLSKPIGIQQQQQQQQTSTPTNLLTNSAIPIFSATTAPIINPKFVSSILNRNDNDSHRKINKYIDDYPQKNIDDVSKYDFNTTIDILFDNLQNEIDGHIKSNEIRERVANYIMRIKAAYNENYLKIYKNRMEIIESKHNIELENEMIKNRLKLLELDNQLLKSQLNNKPQILLQSSSTSSSASFGQIPYLKFFQQNYQCEKLSENNNNTNVSNNNNNSSSNLNNSNTDSTVNETTNTSTSSDSLTNETTTSTTPDNAGSPQQQAAAIALISLHSPPLSLSTPKKNDNKTTTTTRPTSPQNTTSSSTSSSPTYSNVNQILANTFIKLEATS